MNVYDFDKTICKDDTEVDFFKRQLFRRPINLLFAPYYLWAFMLYKIHRFSYKEYRRHTYFTLTFIKDLNKEVEVFWDKRIKKIQPWYLKQQKEDDIITSASPDFLIEPIMKRLNIKNYITSPFDIKTHSFISLNFENQKLVNFKIKYPNTRIDNFYSDSLSDKCMLEISDHAYLLDKNFTLKNWK